MKYILYRPEDLSAEQWQIYADLRNARSLYDNPAFDPDFARLVGDVREDTRIGFASDRDGVFAIWPLHIRPGNWARPLAAPFSKWNGPILAENTELSIEEILAGFDISGLTARGLMPQNKERSPGLRRSGANVIDLSEGWPALTKARASLWPDQMEDLQRYFDGLECARGEVRLDWDDGREDSYAHLLSLKREDAQRRGAPDRFKAPWILTLLDRLRAFKGARFRTRMVSLYAGDRLAAAELNLESDTVMQRWITGCDPELSAHRPDRVLIDKISQHLCDDGFKQYDVGTGGDSEAFQFANVQVPIESGVVTGTLMPLHAQRVVGRAWRLGEQVMPRKASAAMARVRRRMDQIALVETSLSGRATSLLQALSHRSV